MWCGRGWLSSCFMGDGGAGICGSSGEFLIKVLVTVLRFSEWQQSSNLNMSHCKS